MEEIFISRVAFGLIAFLILAYNIKQFMRMTRYEGTDYRVYLITLHDSDMEVVNKYVAIQDLIQHMFSTQHAWVPPTSERGSRYKYSKALYTIPTSIGNTIIKDKTDI